MTNDEICALLDRLEADERELVESELSRLDLGRDAYGAMHIEDSRDDVTEIAEELIDALHYSHKLLLRLRRARERLNRDRARILQVLESARELFQVASETENRPAPQVSPCADMPAESPHVDMAEAWVDRDGLQIEPIDLTRPSKSQQRRIAVQTRRPMPGIEPPHPEQKRSGRSPRRMCAAYGCCYKAHVGGDWCTTHEAEVAAGRTPRRRHEAG